MSQLGLEEKPQLRRGTDGQTASRVFGVTGKASGGAAVADVITHLTDNSGLIYEGLVFDRASYTELGNQAWDVEVTYRAAEFQFPEPPPTGSISYEWSTSLESVRVNQSLGYNTYSASGETAEDHDGLIGLSVDQNGRRSSEGVDILVPIGAFSVTIRPLVALVDNTYQSLLGSLVGKVNSGIFLGRPAGSVLFTGRRGSIRSGGEDYELRLEFSERFNVTGLSLAGISGIAKAGWDYLSPVRKLRVEGNAIKSKVTQVDVHQVYPRASFSGLII